METTSLRFARSADLRDEAPQDVAGGPTRNSSGYAGRCRLSYPPCLWEARKGVYHDGEAFCPVRVMRVKMVPSPRF